MTNPEQGPSPEDMSALAEKWLTRAFAYVDDESLLFASRGRYLRNLRLAQGLAVDSQEIKRMLAKLQAREEAPDNEFRGTEVDLLGVQIVMISEEMDIIVEGFQANPGEI